jgi:short-subunit dehydrogenase
MATVFITGGHAGIDLECSRQLAARGVNLVLAGRSPAAMQSVADELRVAHDVDVAPLAIDLVGLLPDEEPAQLR